MTDPFGMFRPLSYSIICADPPWSFDRWSDTNQSKGAADQYETMDIEAIKALPVGHLAGGDCILFLWACGCMLPEALDAMKAWGFRFCSEIVWLKKTKNGKPRMGTGYRVRTLHEPILVGTNGAPLRFPLPSVFSGLAREHSRKPDEFYDLIRAKTPGQRRIDLFSRERHEGFDAWGDELNKFNAAADVAVTAPINWATAREQDHEIGTVK